MTLGEAFEAFVEGLSQPYLPEEIGMFAYPVWGMLFVAFFGILSQQGSEPRTSKQKNFRFTIYAIFLFMALYGLIVAFSYAWEVY